MSFFLFILLILFLLIGWPLLRGWLYMQQLKRRVNESFRGRQQHERPRRDYGDDRPAQLGHQALHSHRGGGEALRNVCQHFDVADHPDVVPVMAALACLLPADFTFLHTSNLRYKESDRVGELAVQLSPFAEVECRDDSLRIVGRARALWPQPPYAFRTCHDHRLAMAFLLFGPDALPDDLACLGKSYPLLPDILQNDM